MKIGPNDLCPCGSGIKYKKCCADKQKGDSQRGMPVRQWMAMF